MGTSVTISNAASSSRLTFLLAIFSCFDPGWGDDGIFMFAGQLARIMSYLGGIFEDFVNGSEQTF